MYLDVSNFLEMISLDNNTLWVWLDSVCCISRAKQNRLLAHFGDIESIYKAEKEEYLSVCEFTKEELELLSNKFLTRAKDELERLSAIGGQVISRDDERYPDLLLQIHTPPNILYVRGQLFDLNSYLMIAMVGTRKASGYGLTSAKAIAKELSNSGAVVVSGLASGIDAMSHEGALVGKSPTVAVIGCGTDICYPKSNTGLMNRIINRGLVISEYPLGTIAQKFHFPERNRIISGITRGTLVVEADIKSGSLITAKYALEQNRDVFAVPGNINSINSKGSNYLLKDGANLVTTASDILDFYGCEAMEYTPREEISSSNNTAENKILNVLNIGSLHKDTICEKTGLGASEVNSLLLLMELKGMVMHLPGGYYTKPI